MVMCVDQTRHDDAAVGVDDLGSLGSEIGAYRADSIALDEDVTDAHIWNPSIQGDDRPALDECPSRGLCAHDQILAKPMMGWRSYPASTGLNKEVLCQKIHD
jgi:hypothetical protein